MKQQLLTRTQFRESTFQRDNYKCVFCDQPAKDAHHIMERRLFSDGGYYLNNGASVCHEHHMKCETTELSLLDVRAACKISNPVIPDHLYPDYEYDKWGNMIMSNGQRTKGELFHDPSIQWVLGQGNKLDLFTQYVKYPRTYHLPWSGSVSEDDRILKDYKSFIGKRVIVTNKMDGSNVTMYYDKIHGRSFDTRSHPISGRVKALWSQFQADIPEGWRVCGEDLYNKHSIYYDDLESYLYGYSVWNDMNECLCWDETVEYLDLFGIPTVEVLYDGIWDEDAIKNLTKTLDFEKSEGFVVRPADKFTLAEFKTSMAKFVRPNHHMTVVHNLANARLTQNKLK